MISVLVPSFNDGMLMRLFASMEKSEPGSLRHVIVLDNGLSPKLIAGCPSPRYVIVPAAPFVFSEAFNTGVRAAHAKHDIVCFSDDVVIRSKGWFSALVERFDDWPDEYGLLTCAEQSTSTVYGHRLHPDEIVDLPDIALGAGILIPRRVLKQIGPWDETFVGYGFDDFDYGVRLLHAGYRLGITGAVVLDNLTQAAGWVKRLGSYEAVLAHQDINYYRFHEKWHGAIPEKPWVVQRPVTNDHFRRQGCSCLERGT